MNYNFPLETAINLKCNFNYLFGSGRIERNRHEMVNAYCCWFQALIASPYNSSYLDFMLKSLESSLQCLASSIINPIFYDTMVDTVVYGHISNILMELPDDSESTEGYFQQNAVTCHASDVSMNLIFGDCLITNSLLSPQI